jgi:hypothetical protein
MNLETRRPRGRPRNGWQDEVREDGRMVDGEECLLFMSLHEHVGHEIRG